MNNATMYCLSLHNKTLFSIKKMGYTPVGLGSGTFSNEWNRDNTLDNISHKNKYYGEYTFHYWFWKNVLPDIEDWFLIDQGSNELLPSEINPKKNCYIWVEEKVERKR